YLLFYPSVILCIVRLLFSFFFFLMIRRPPRSTLFPYTRSSDLGVLHRARFEVGDADEIELAERILDAEVVVVELHRGLGRRQRRSEEHTSELQSQSNLVCRLLLEKKKKPQISISTYIINTN